MALKIENPLETAIGAAVLAAAVAFGLYASSADSAGPSEGYAEYTAHFLDATGITPGTDVRLAGVKVGQVEEVRLDRTPIRYRAAVTISVVDTVEVTNEAEAIVDATGLLGGAYLDLQVGGGEPIASGGVIRGIGGINLRRLITTFGGGSDG